MGEKQLRLLPLRLRVMGIREKQLRLGPWRLRVEGWKLRLKVFGGLHGESRHRLSVE